MTSQPRPRHPGTYIREFILKPKKLPVTKAAELVGVGRPALSNFLNGKAAATAEMAARLEVAFGISAKELLGMQAAFDAAQATTAGAAVSARRYVVPLLEFKANDFEQWVHKNIRARTRYAVLLRTLVNSTANVTKSDFPGNDDAEKAGWDGWCECEQGNPWVPAGKSGWEFGTNEKVKDKADGDYEKSVKAMDREERLETTFVFVSPRRWNGKGEWVKDRLAEKQWKDVRAFDATDLEQWVAQSVPSQAWLAAELDRPTQEVASLDDSWLAWRGAAKPEMPAALFDTAVAGTRTNFLQWFKSTPEKPFLIASDSTEEALAFMSALLPDSDASLAAIRDRVIVFREAGALRKLAKGATDFIAVATSNEVQQELATAAQELHAVIVLPRNAAGVEPNAVLEPLTPEAFSRALESAGYSRDDINRLAKESGRSLTLLRRRLSDLPAVRTPPWANDKAVASAMIAVYLAGSWNSKNEADTKAVAHIAGVDDYEILEEKMQALTALQQAPAWSVGTYRGVFSKIDALFASAPLVTEAALKRFFEQTKLILDEDDPKLDLDEDKRWAAAIYDKSREYSQSLRDGVAESLVLLSVHGNNLFGRRIGFDCTRNVEGLVQSLLEPVTERRLEAAGRDLLSYAEAAPATFLTTLERDLASSNPQAYGLLRPAEGMFGGCPRTSLLWALEGLAWSEKTLPRVALILAKLARIEIRDNWSNKPISSLNSIFKSWMPQTAADLQTRLRVVRLVADKEPAVGWSLAVKLLDPRDQFGSTNHKPRWRNDGYGYGEPVATKRPIEVFRAGVAEMVLHWSQPYTSQMVCDLLDVSNGLNAEHADQVWKVIEHWAGEASDAERVTVREKIRVSVLSKRVAKRVKRQDWPELTKQAAAAYKLLEPTDILFRHAWLFKQAWVSDSADDLFEGSEESDLEARDKRIYEMRTKAVRELLAAKGIEGVRMLASLGEAGHVIGGICTKVLDGEQLAGLAQECATAEPLSAVTKALLAGLIDGLAKAQVRPFFEKLKANVTDSQYVEVLLRAQFCRPTWQMVDGLSDEQRYQYWQSVMPWRVSDEDVHEAVRRLVAVGRPRTAFSVAQYQLKLLGAESIFQVLSMISRAQSEEPGNYKLDQHWLHEAFGLLNSSQELSLEQKAGLEFAYIEGLGSHSGRHDTHLIPNLEKYLELHPDFYVQALVWAYKRRDGVEDPVELQPPQGSQTVLATRAFTLLEGMTRLPAYAGSAQASSKNLHGWIDRVRGRAQELGRVEVTDVCLGRLLSAEAPAPDGIWPGQLAREAIEYVGTEQLAQGAVVGLMNARGVVTRARGGVQERELAARYREWASVLQYSHPFVAREVLETLAASYERDARREDESELLRERLE